MLCLMKFVYLVRKVLHEGKSKNRSHTPHLLPTDPKRVRQALRANLLIHDKLLYVILSH